MFQNSECHVRISAGFLLLVFWFCAVNGVELLLVILSAAAAHELGHWGMLLCFGVRPRCLRIGILGAVLEADCSRLSYGREMAAVLAGPGINLLCAWILSRVGRGTDLVVGTHLVLGAFNLIPLRPLDGGRALYLLTAWVFGPWSGDLAARWIGTAAAMLLAGGLVWLMYQTGGSLWLLPASVGIVMAAGREWFEKEVFL